MQPFYSFFVLLTICQFCKAISLDEELTLTLREKKVLDQFKLQVSSEVPYAFLKTDLILLRYLRARNFDKQRAEEMLLNTVKWRKENQIDTINDEDWSDFELDYRYYLAGEDKLGRPILSLFAQEWDIRQGVLSGKQKKMIRYYWKCFEESAIKIRQAQALEKNVTQSYFIYDLSGYNLVQQGCPQCLPVIINFLLAFENHYVGSVHKFVLINTPGIFQVTLNVLRPLMSKSTSDALRIYGTDKDQWMNALKEDITDDNLLIDFGGQLPRPLFEFN